MVANGNLDHEMGSSWRLFAGLSPVAVFFPRTYLEHLLERMLSGSVKRKLNLGHTLQ
jgi:hypothetical protein